MVEPSGAYRYVDLGGPPYDFAGLFKHRPAPEVGSFRPELQPGVLVILIAPRKHHGAAPFGLAPYPFLVAYPAHVVAHDGGDGSGLQPGDYLSEAVEVVFLLLAVGAFAAGSVKPYLVDFAVVCKQLGELVDEHVVVCRGVAVAGGVAVPGGEVDAEFHAVFVARLPELPHDVAVTSEPGGGLDGMRCRSRRPQAEAVVVLCGENHELYPRVAERAHPLAGVEPGGVEDGRVLLPVAPFAVGKGVHSEMQEGCQAEFLPGELGVGRHHASGHFGFLSDSSSFRESYFFDECLIVGGGSCEGRRERQGGDI